MQPIGLGRSRANHNPRMSEHARPHSPYRWPRWRVSRPSPPRPARLRQQLVIPPTVNWPCGVRIGAVAVFAALDAVADILRFKTRIRARSALRDQVHGIGLATVMTR